MKKTRPAKSSLIVAQLLDSEGYSDYTAAQIRRYWYKNSVATDRQKARVARITKAFTDHVGSQLTESQRMVLGKYIAMLNREKLTAKELSEIGKKGGRPKKKKVDES